ncbi:Scytalone dehydratase [Balamuthia mandrillaris]
MEVLDLPVEIQYHILGLVSGKQLAAVMLTCRRWRDIASSDSFWGTLYWRDFARRRMCSSHLISSHHHKRRRRRNLPASLSSSSSSTPKQEEGAEDEGGGFGWREKYSQTWRWQRKAEGLAHRGTFKFHRSVRSLHFDEEELVSGATDNTVLLTRWVEGKGGEGGAEEEARSHLSLEVPPTRWAEMDAELGEASSVLLLPRVLITGHHKGAVAIRDRQTLQKLSWWCSHSAFVWSMACFEDVGEGGEKGGSAATLTLATGGHDGLIVLSDVTRGGEGKPLQTFSSTFALPPVTADRIYGLKIKDKMLISGGESSGAIIWDVRSGQKTHEYEHKGEAVRSLDYQGGNYFVTGTSEGVLRYWEVRKLGPPVHKVETRGPITCLQFDDAKIVCGASKRLVAYGLLQQQEGELKMLQEWVVGAIPTCLQYDHEKMACGLWGQGIHLQTL